ncbi:MAG: hypothetical protein FWG50_14235 [Kiritimatiellaeota bacterium]|nr:hypothetical protein [Kiritimatiellota bacterium]
MSVSAKKILAVFLGFGMVLLAWGDEEEKALRRFDEFEQAMLQQIGRIHADCDVSELYKIDKLRTSYSTAVARTPFGSVERKVADQAQQEGREIILYLKFLQAVIAAHDPGYDIYHPPSSPAKIIPPPPFWPRSDPESIEDPVIREKYKKYLAEADKHYMKHQRERMLDGMRKELIVSLKGEIKYIKQLNPSRLPHVIALLDEAIDDTGVKQAIMEDMAKPPPEPKPLPPPEKIKGPVHMVRDFAARIPFADDRKLFLDDITKGGEYTEEEIKLLYAPYE